MYMPQYHNGESWNDMWFSPCYMDRAKSITNMLLRDTRISRDQVRILFVVS